ncbi:MAG: L-seryl-tRNA(Sec) selenium transferase [Bacillota bacterium]
MTQSSFLRSIPSISDVLEHPAAVDLSARLPRWAVRNAARKLIAEQRARLERLAGGQAACDVGDREATEGVLASTGIARLDAETAPTRASILDAVLRALPAAAQRCATPGPRPVINATGIVLHTNLGRAPLPDYAAQAVAECARAYSDLEFDLATGERGSRQDHVAGAIARICGAQAAYAVNNNAAAVLLCLDTIARGREVLVSRGELVEIGGSFRVPDIMERSGARLVEVGTTNRTRVSDYRRVASPEVGLLLKVHTSNFRIVGFTEEADITELVSLGRETGLPVMYDIGSGLMADMSRYGMGSEPTVTGAVSAGADLVTFSGDKLFGGPQAGIIVGRADLIERIARNPLARALRIDKLTLCALAAAAAAWEDRDAAEESVPVANMLAAEPGVLAQRAARLAELIRLELDKACADPASVDISVVDDPSEAGGGSLPTVSIPGASVCIRAHGVSCDELQRRLRMGDPPVVARVADDSVRFHLRTIFDRDFGQLAAATASAIASATGAGRIGGETGSPREPGGNVVS